MAAEADGEVANVDHFLNFAVALRLDFAHFQSHQRAEDVLFLTQGIAELPHDLAALRRGHRAPVLEG